MAERVVDEFVAAADPAFAAVVRAVDDAVWGAADLARAVKWRKLTYARDGDFHHWICAIAVSRTRVTLTFHFGGLLDDEAQAFRVGSSKFLRMLDFVTADQVDADLIGRYVEQALSRLDYFKANWRTLTAGS